MKAKVKKLLAVLMALTVVLSFGACGKDKKPETKESTSVSEEAETEENKDVDAEADDEEDTEEESEDDTDEAEVDDEDDVDDNTTKSAKKSTKKSTSKSTSKATKKTTKKSSNKTTKKGGDKTTIGDDKTTTKKTTAKDPSTKAEILKLYATATEKAQNCKSLEKTRTTKSNSEIPGFYKGLVEKFLGIGDKNAYKNTEDDGSRYTYKDKDGKNRYCVTKSTLTADDIKDASIEKKDGNYIVTIKVKNGSSSSGKKGANAKNNSPVDKCGICTGNRDIDIFDHKTAEICAKAAGGIVNGVEEKTSNVTVKATINKSSSKLQNLVITFDIQADIDALGGISATGTTTVTCKNFKY